MYAPIREDLIRCEAMLEAELASDHRLVDQLVKHCFRLSGKRLRPALVLLAGKAVGRVEREHIVLATVLEMIHTATLVHDDVLDGAVLRRHMATVNAKWDPQASVLLGDFLFTHAFCLASTLGDPYACLMIGRATNAVCEGELRQVQDRGNLSLSESDYLLMIQAKTAELCACCCRLGAHYAGAAPETVEVFARFGRDLGIAFQIIDDILDLVGDESATGKSLGSDLRLQKATLPLIRLLGQLGIDDRRELKARLACPAEPLGDILRPWLARSDALEYTAQRAAWFARQARAALDGLPPSPALLVLRDLTEFVISRRQ